MCGDGYIEVFVDNITAKGFAGISLRESQAAGAKKVEIGTDNVARIIRAARVIDGYPAFPQELISFDKFWLKIERTGNSFRASASTDGVSYTPYLFQTIMMGECLEAGLWAYSLLLCCSPAIEVLVLQLVPVLLLPTDSMNP